MLFSEMNREQVCSTTLLYDAIVMLSALHTLDDWHSVLSEPIKDVLKTLGNIVGKLQKAIYFLFLQVCAYTFDCI